MGNIIPKILARKVLSGFVLIMVLGVGYYAYTKYFTTTAATRYMTASAEKGTLIVSISGSGQVSVLSQVDMKSKASGEITGLYVALGQEVSAGTLLVAIDASDAKRAVRDAETSLETAKLELDKTLEPLDELTLLQSENSLTQAKESKKRAEDNLKKAYEDGFNSISNAFLELPSLMVGLQDILYGTTLAAGGQPNLSYYADSIKNYDEKALQYKNDTSSAYQEARLSYDKNFLDYKSISRFSNTKTIEALVDETYETTKSIAELVKRTNDFIQFYQDKLTERMLKPNPSSSTHLSSLVTYTGKTNSTLSSLLSIKRTIQDSKEAIVSAEQSIKEKELSLAKLKEGPDTLDIRAKKIAIQQREDALLTAGQALADHYVRAPFNGVIAKVSAKKGDAASAGMALVTLITKQKIAEVSLNEVDVAKVKVGQKTTLTFDAVSNLSITGSVAEIDAMGTVSQGVVTYSVKIGFDTQDERVKSSMSVSAAIITDVKPDVLLVPNSAVKTDALGKYVEVLNSGTVPTRTNVETGLSNDTTSEITNGLKESDKVVTQTITSTTQTTTQNTGIRIPGLGGGGGGGPGR
ncbi:MAG: hypothetical protein A3H69_05700 [Candidatus Sungbacteria bacterium RIFCSPLOWO2_02_FULL_47_9]|uniref:Uncharacterized protein n=1 Tax=Candidatus Sungbacteria bacterium RIFCSPHIGHO2_01_FULL_47_32 TaxID=1802264 RepID=A0A1G2K8I3_9BACT|nr:MAG: Efflux transporter, RND family, MFP subunit [Parcubacteria group bacterium GW2011_GWA2_47_10]OGZ95774.1 MAG: hypothetical protein A2633_00575 [Candidatus Sungbacteria bacterium RIFCSPHIGHO2_01_FULL_47_32]OGZ99089.1 MAG: hypothetical protein A3D57_03500 [Candidatus Sungbacteria bacterium RIFCSPHIGHO2_02_FULL_46_12]OHA04581.1 MAG: hypothetical protein A3A28_01320 [Candidatus Sungbacteria bacterium RIFCSPLOWO2_01_FULL_47_32]OHA10126.1 MAG: hypothetical protein A3H69_05700 [Candidatus Sungb